MADEPSTGECEPETRLHEAIASFEQARDAGQDPNPQEWLGRYPDVASRLAAFFADQEQLHRLAGPLRPQANRVALAPGGEPETFPEVPGYQILEVIGWGGMGVVYKARQLSADRIVALKVIRPDRLEGLSPDERRKAVERFITEAQAAAKLEHENIVQVYEVGEFRGRPFYSMRYVVGTSLHDLIQRGPLEGRRAASYLEKVARAVHEAHRHGILHRDLKPHNILLSARSNRIHAVNSKGPDESEHYEPLVADFGLAKLLQGGRDVTGTGDVMGTPPYISPEQAQGSSQLTVATDVYGLGATLYALLTGRPPFSGDDPVRTLRKVVEEEALPPRAINPLVHRDLETICLKCLEKEPRKRYGNAEELANRLQLFLEGKPIPDRPITQVERFGRWCRRNPILAATECLAAAGMVAVVAVSIAFAIHANRAAEYESSAANNLRSALDDAKTQRTLAEGNERTAQDRLARMYVANGLRFMEEGELFASLLWFVKALEEEKGGPEREEIHRMRIGAVLRQCPKLVQFWVDDRNGPVTSPVPNYAEFSGDGRYVVAASSSATAWVWDAVSGRPVSPPMKHDGWLLHASFSPDGRRVVTCSSLPDPNSLRGEARVWDAVSGQPVSPPLKHNGPVLRAAFSPDGRRVVTAHTQRLAPTAASGVEAFIHEARVWDAVSGQPVSPPLKHNAEVWHAAFSTDGRRVVTASADTKDINKSWVEVRAWDASSGQPVSLPLKDNGPVFAGWCAAAFSLDASRVLTASKDGTARVWDVGSGKPVSPPIKHDGRVLHAAFSPDGHRVVTCSRDHISPRSEARVWDAVSAQPVSPPMKHDGMLQVAFSPDGRRVVIVSDDQTARVWDAESGQPVSPSMKHSARVLHAAFSPEGRRVVTRTEMSGMFAAAPETRVWDVASGQPLSPDLTGGIHAAFSPDGRRIVTAGIQMGPGLGWTAARIWDVVTGKPLSPCLNHNSLVVHAEFSPDGRRVVTASLDETARVWDAASGRPACPPLNHNKNVHYAGFSPDGRLVVTASDDQTARVWDAETGQPVSPPMKHGREVRHAAFSPDGRYVVTSSFDGTARVWDAKTGQPFSLPMKHNGAVNHAVFSPDGRHVLSASGSASNVPGEARVWDVERGQPISAPMKHGSPVRHAAFSPDGRRVATASDDQTARVWDAESGYPMSPPLKHNSPVLHAAFSPNGRLVVTASLDHTARVWDAESGQAVSPTLKHNWSVFHAAFSSDGRRLVTSGSVTAQLWDLQPDDRPVADLRLLSELLSGQDVGAGGAFVDVDAKTLYNDWQMLRQKYSGDFSTTPEQIVSWHRREAQKCEAAAQWSGAIWHLDRVTESESANETILLARGRAHSELGNMDNSMADYSKAIELKPNDAEPLLARGKLFAQQAYWTKAVIDFAKSLEFETNWPVAGWHALALAGASQTKEHRKTCTTLLQHLKEADGRFAASLVVWFCVRFPEAVADPARPLELAEKAVNSHPKDHFSLKNLGAALYRANRFEESIKKLNEAMQARGLEDTETAKDWLFLTMAHHRLGHAEEAKKWLTKAQEWIDQATQEKPKDRTVANRLSWDQRLELKLIRAEAEALLKEDPKK